MPTATTARVLFALRNRNVVVYIKRQLAVLKQLLEQLSAINRLVAHTSADRQLRAIAAALAKLDESGILSALRVARMAGRSTLLRSLGVIILFAHLGLPVPAECARVPIVNRLMTAINAQDSLSRGESLYVAEVRRVREVVRAVASGETVIALLDEAFRGTNVMDALEAMGMLVDGLARAQTGLFVLASHLTEIARERFGHPHVSLWCMHVDAIDDPSSEGVRFTYAFRRGVSDVRLGMRLLEREGVVTLLAAIRP